MGRRRIQQRDQAVFRQVVVDVFGRAGIAVASPLEFVSHLLVVEGNPLKSLRVLQMQDNLKVIMKGGRFFKRTS